MSCKVVGGGFKSYAYGSKPGTVAHGPTERFGCVVCRDLLKADKKAFPQMWTPLGCAERLSIAVSPNTVPQEKDLVWFATYEQADDDNWYLTVVNNIHFRNHDLSDDPAPLRATTSSIPAELMMDAEEWFRYGDTVAAINRKLEQKAKELGRDVTWTSQHLYNQLRERRSLSVKDGEGFAKLLQSRSDQGLPTAYRVKDALEVSCAFAVMKNYDAIWASSTRVLMYDPIANASRQLLP